MDCTMQRRRSRTLLGIILTALLVSEISSTETSEPDCSSVVGFSAEVPPSAIIAPEHGACGGALTCCTPEMEDELMRTMENYFIDSLQSNVKKMSKVFDESYHRLVRRFEDKIEVKRNETEYMFRQTYGQLFQTAELDSIFHLISYFYKNGYDQDPMADYFKNLLLLLFETLNAQYSFDDEFKRCLEAHDWIANSTLKESIRKVQKGIKRSVIAIRAYTKGLLTGRDTIRSLMWFEPDEDCVKELVRMRGCMQCSGNQGTPICSHYCSEFLDLCLARHESFTLAWTMYNDVMHSLQMRLVKEFNVDTMLDKLYLDISEIIMDFQENAVVFNEKVFSACGRPRLARRSLHRAKRSPLFQNKSESEITGLLSSIQEKIKFPIVDLCKEEQTSTFNCWNGTAVGNYTFALFRDPFGESAEGSSEVPKTDLRPTVVPLSLATTKLRAAVWGKDPEWLDYESKMFEICRSET